MMYFRNYSMVHVCSRQVASAREKKNEAAVQIKSQEKKIITAATKNIVLIRSESPVNPCRRQCGFTTVPEESPKNNGSTDDAHKTVKRDFAGRDDNLDLFAFLLRHSIMCRVRDTHDEDRKEEKKRRLCWAAGAKRRSDAALSARCY